MTHDPRDQRTVVHLVRTGPARRAACGAKIRKPMRTTSAPEEVTCPDCRRAMAGPP